MEKIRQLTPELDLIIKELKPYKPNKIVLFGSRARGDHQPDSDFDLAIIKDNIPQTQRRVLAVLNLLYKDDFNHLIYNLPDIEPQVYTSDEFQERLNMGDFFAKTINREGKIIYEQGE